MHDSITAFDDVALASPVDAAPIGEVRPRSVSGHLERTEELQRDRRRRRWGSRSCLLLRDRRGPGRGRGRGGPAGPLTGRGPRGFPGPPLLAPRTRPKARGPTSFAATFGR